MFSIRRAANRVGQTSAVSAAISSAGVKTVSISSLRAITAAAVSVSAARQFSVAVPKQLSATAPKLEGEEEEQKRRTVHEDLPPPQNGLFVQNYAFSLTEDAIASAFSKYGEVTTVFIPEGKSYCFVYYKDPEHVKVAAENVDGTYWLGRRLAVRPRTAGLGTNSRYATPERPFRDRPQVFDNVPTDTLFIGNISYNCTDADLNEVFGNLEGVKDVRVAVDSKTGQSRGFVHAQFVDVAAATAAMGKLKGTQILEREIRIDFAPTYKNDLKRQPGGPVSRRWDNTRKELSDNESS